VNLIDQTFGGGFCIWDVEGYEPTTPSGE